jgi:hypothetical protein
MKTFTIENETNEITAHATKREATSVPTAECFTTVEEFAELAANWPASRMIEIWNSLPGVTPVNKFKDRKTAVTRIWNVIQSLGESAASEAAPEQNPEPQAKTEPVTESDKRESTRRDRRRNGIVVPRRRGLSPAVPAMPRRQDRRPSRQVHPSQHREAPLADQRTLSTTGSAPAGGTASDYSSWP